MITVQEDLAILLIEDWLWKPPPLRVMLVNQLEQYHSHFG